MSDAKRNNEHSDTAENTVRVSSAQESNMDPSSNRTENLGEGSNEIEDLSTQLEFGEVNRDLVSSSTPVHAKHSSRTELENEQSKAVEEAMSEHSQLPKVEGTRELDRLKSANALGINEQIPLLYHRKRAPNRETATNVFTDLLQDA